MRGIVLAAGGGTRLRPLTDELPKALLTVTDDGRSLLELAVANLAAAGVSDVTIVGGHAVDRIDELVPGLAQAHGIPVTVRDNPRHAELNNAYSLWLVADVLAEGAIVVNGDTLHPASVERTLLGADTDAGIVLALDDHKTLGEEEMKVTLGDDGTVASITKQMEPSTAAGEYIGVTLVRPSAAADLADALERTFQHDPATYYEDGFQTYVDDGNRVAVASIGEVAWTEVDDHDDLARAREIAAQVLRG